MCFPTHHVIAQQCADLSSSAIESFLDDPRMAATLSDVLHRDTGDLTLCSFGKVSCLRCSTSEPICRERTDQRRGSVASRNPSCLHKRLCLSRRKKFGRSEGSMDETPATTSSSRRYTCSQARQTFLTIMAFAFSRLANCAQGSLGGGRYALLVRTRARAGVPRTLAFAQQQPNALPRASTSPRRLYSQSAATTTTPTSLHGQPPLTHGKGKEREVESSDAAEDAQAAATASPADRSKRSTKKAATKFEVSR